MSRRAANHSRSLIGAGANPLAGSLHHPKSRASPLLSVALIVLGAFFLIAYCYSGSGGLAAKEAVSSNTAGSCTSEVQKAIPVLKKIYGDSMSKVLHVGPETCAVISKLLKEEETEAWGVEPYDLEDADSSCKSLVHKGLVRVADIKFPLPYRPKSYSLVIVSDALDYLSPNPSSTNKDTKFLRIQNMSLAPLLTCLKVIELHTPSTEPLARYYRAANPSPHTSLTLQSHAHPHKNKNLHPQSMELESPL